MVTGDSWYSGVTNLKTLRSHQTGFMFAIEKNRTVPLEKGHWQQAQNLDIPDSSLDVWLRDFGKVRLFRTTLKDQLRHYVAYLPEEAPFERDDFSEINDQHWQIEQYHECASPTKSGYRTNGRKKEVVGLKKNQCQTDEEESLPTLINAQVKERKDVADYSQ